MAFVSLQVGVLHCLERRQTDYASVSMPEARIYQQEHRKMPTMFLVTCIRKERTPSQGEP
jgi:hypothetical protein